MNAPKKIRADLLVVERGLAPTRTRAQALILEGQIVATGGGAGERRVEKAGDLLRADCELRTKGDVLKYVSRGGLKVEHAIDTFHLPTQGIRAIDVGASTGGFTDCLLQRGALHVTCVDVGRGQLHEKLRQDPRVTSYEQMNARQLPATLTGFDALVIDVSFISLSLVLPNLCDRVREGGWLACLVKPQFECGREWVGDGGVVRDEGARALAVQKVHQCLEIQGCRIFGSVPSPLLGPAGNVEFLIAASKIR